MVRALLCLASGFRILIIWFQEWNYFLCQLSLFFKQAFISYPIAHRRKSSLLGVGVPSDSKHSYLILPAFGDGFEMLIFEEMNVNMSLFTCRQSWLRIWFKAWSRHVQYLMFYVSWSVTNNVWHIKLVSMPDQ